MSRPCPPLRKVFKIVESPATRAQYDLYKYMPFEFSYPEDGWS
jgi:hypothetical protein